MTSLQWISKARQIVFSFKATNSNLLWDSKVEAIAQTTLVNAFVLHFDSI